MADFFIRRPIFAIVIALIMVILGIIAAVQLPIAQYPQIAPPTAMVTTTYVGADAATVNNAVAQQVESQVNGVQGLNYMSSNSDSSGSYSLEVVFDVGSDSDMDVVKTQNSVATSLASLPSEVQASGVTTSKSSSGMDFMFSLYSPKGKYDAVFIKNYADVYFLDNLKRIKGIGNITAYGADRSLRVWLNPERMASLGLTAADISSAIRAQNKQAPVGSIGQMPVSKDQEKKAIGRTKGRLTSKEDFENIILRSEPNGAFVYLKDVARIEYGARDMNYISFQDGYEGVGFGVSLTSDANALQTISEVKQVMSDAQKNFPPDLQYKPVVDSTKFINESLGEVMHTFAEAMALVILIVYLFLQSWRATLIPVLAIPVSLITTFGAFILLDFSINTLTLFAMVLAIGLVVDDAIVVIENVEHHLSKGMIGVKDATIKAMKEVQGPVVAIAFVLAAVFIPVAFLGGMMGVLYRQFALTIAISMAISAFTALTLTPALCVLLLKPPTAEVKDKSLVQRFFDWFNQWFERMKRGYMKHVISLMRRARYAVLFLLLLVIGIGVLYRIVPSTFVPDEDQGYFMVAVNLPEGTSFNRTLETMHKLTDYLKEQKGIDGVMEINGFDIMSNGVNSSAGALFVSLDDWKDRKDSSLSLEALLGKVGMEAPAVAPEASVIPMNPPALPGLGMTSGLSLQLQDVTGHTDEELNDVAQKIMAAAQSRPELENVSTPFRINSPYADFEIDRAKVMSYGIDMDAVFEAMQVNFGGSEINDFNQFGRSYKVVMQADAKFRSEMDSAKFIFVKARDGSFTPLSNVLKVKSTTGASIISRFNGARSINFQGQAAEGYSSGQAMDAIEQIVHEQAGDGYNIEWSGQSRQEKLATGSTFKVLGLAFLFVFLCLAALYNSWSIPYAVLLSVPTGIFGALLFELVMFQPNSIYMQIGVIMIIGLAAKNAILIVEFAKERVDQGMDPVRAAIVASGLRLRPILMTSAAFIVGCLPLMAASGAGAAARNAMGNAVVGGMVFATAFGLFLIPVLYIIVEQLSMRISRMFHKSESK